MLPKPVAIDQHQTTTSWGARPRNTLSAIRRRPAILFVIIDGRGTLLQVFRGVTYWPARPASAFEKQCHRNSVTADLQTVHLMACQTSQPPPISATPAMQNSATDAATVSTVHCILPSPPWPAEMTAPLQSILATPSAVLLLPLPWALALSCSAGGAGASPAAVTKQAGLLRLIQQACMAWAEHIPARQSLQLL